MGIGAGVRERARDDPRTVPIGPCAGPRPSGHEAEEAPPDPVGRSEDGV